MSNKAKDFYIQHYEWVRKDEELIPDQYMLDILDENHCSGNFGYFTVYNFEKYCNNQIKYYSTVTEEKKDIVNYHEMWVLIQKEIGKIRTEKIMRSYDWKMSYTKKLFEFKVKIKNENCRINYFE